MFPKSVKDNNTRRIAKGKAGQPVELGVPVTIVESRQQFVLDWRIHW